MAKAATTAPALDADRQITLDEIMGHREAVDYLKRSIRLHQLPRSLLITGPRGVGKKTLAWALIREIAARGEDPKTHAGSLKVARGVHPDIRVCDGSDSVSGQIPIDTIREADDWAATSPLEATRKILMIASAQKMNIAAANCLLKLLEEPPRHVMMILTTPDPALLLPTIRSRCTPLALDAVAPNELIPWLAERTSADAERVELAARLAEGRPGHARLMLESGALDARGEIVRELAVLREHGFAVVFRVADRLGALHGDLSATLGLVLVILRDCLSITLDLDQILNRDIEDELRRLAEAMEPAGILAAADCLDSAIKQAPGFYTPQAKAHFLEILIADVGKELKSHARQPC